MSYDPILVMPAAPSDVWPGDLIFWHSWNPWALLIQRLDGSCWNHVSVAGGDVGSMVVHVQSERRGVESALVPFAKLLRPGRAAIVRPRPGNGAAGLRAFGAAVRYMGRPYALHTLVLLAGVMLARRGKFPRAVGRACAWLAARGGKQSLICSELARRAWRDAGVDLCSCDPNLATPADLWAAIEIRLEPFKSQFLMPIARDVARAMDEDLLGELEPAKRIRIPTPEEMRRIADDAGIAAPPEAYRAAAEGAAEKIAKEVDDAVVEEFLRVVRVARKRRDKGGKA